jgi:hypothetical protein
LSILSDPDDWQAALLVGLVLYGLVQLVLSVAGPYRCREGGDDDLSAPWDDTEMMPSGAA